LTTSFGTKTWRTWKSRKIKIKRRKRENKTSAKESYKMKTKSIRTARWQRATMKKGNKPSPRSNPTIRKMPRWRRLQKTVNETQKKTKMRIKRLESITTRCPLSQKSPSQRILSLNLVTICPTRLILKREKTNL
jgi:hypothetical protein